LLTGETIFEDDEKLLVYNRKSANGTLTVLANATDSAAVRICQGKDVFSGREIKSKITVKPHSIRVIVS